MSTPSEQEIREDIHKFVYCGFYDDEEILQIICQELYQPGEVDEEWAFNLIDETMMKKYEIEESWAETTDCDRLDRAFDELEAEGIIALQNAGADQSDGLSDIADEYEALGGEESNVDGYCFYHFKDIEHALEGKGIYLAFGAINGSRERSAEIGQKISETLEREGLKTQWSGNVDERIFIPKFNWQRRATFI